MSLKRLCERLREENDIVILAHQNPDGDTLGSSFALLFALQSMGKRARVECSDAFPLRYQFMFSQYMPQVFEPRLVVAADVAAPQLLGANEARYAGRVDFCIDHHPSNTCFAKETYLVDDAAATAEIMCDVLDELGASLDLAMATCLYTGIATDTGCFRFSNTSAKTHLAAARMIALGVDNAQINRDMFGCKTQGRIAMEREVYNTMEYHFDGQCALICMTRDMMERTGADDAELEGLSGIPCQIEGVEVGITVREKTDGYKISLRTNHYINASEICAKLGGGGHARASGCFLDAPLAEVKSRILSLVGETLAQAQPGCV